MTIDGGGARSAERQGLPAQRPRHACTSRNFQVEDFGKLYRSCGNCSEQYERTS